MRRLAGIVGIASAVQRVADFGGEWDARAKHNYPEGDDEPAQPENLVPIGQPDAIQSVSFERAHSRRSAGGRTLPRSILNLHVLTFPFSVVSDASSHPT